MAQPRKRRRPSLKDENSDTTDVCRWYFLCIITRHISYPIWGDNMDKGKLKIYGIFILLTEAVGAVAGLLTALGMEKYAAAEKPALTPPAFLFPIAWSILYALMGAGITRVWLTEESGERSRALRLYGVQLFMNFMWSIFFFNFQAYGFAFFWLLILLLFIIFMTFSFSRVDKISGYLQIPYILWVSFAAYLNLMVWLLNR